jgi:hypothetical protein
VCVSLNKISEALKYIPKSRTEQQSRAEGRGGGGGGSAAAAEERSAVDDTGNPTMMMIPDFLLHLLKPFSSSFSFSS